MTYPKSVKEIKNLNEFIRKAREFETDKYWSNILYDCSSANYADWTRKESRLKWKREIIQKYLDYKNNKLNEGKLIEMKQALIYEINSKLDKLKGVTDKHFKTTAQGRPRKQLEFNYNNKTIRIVNVHNDDFVIFINNKCYDKNSRIRFNDIEEILDIVKGIKLEEKASIDWNNYLTTEEVKKFLSKDDKVESAKDIIYSKEFEPRYKDLHNPLQAKFKNSWTRKELVKDLNNFYNFGHLITESKHKIEEKSRNELLAKTKSQTITRYNKAQEYKGFYIRGVDTDELLKKDSLLTINCQVGNYRDQVQMENMLYWVEYEIEERNHDLQVTTKYVTQALMDAIDGMNIKVNCECGDWKFRMAYQATKYGYKYGTPENRPAKIRNPNDIGALCKHITSLLSNKKWLQQVTSILMDFIIDNIDRVNQFLRRQPGKEFTTPNAEARALGKQSVYKKFLNRQDLIQEIANEFIKESEDKLFTMNTNLDDDLQRFINDNYSVQKITAQEFKVIRELINKYIQENTTEEPEENNEESEEENNEDI